MLPVVNANDENTVYHIELCLISDNPQILHKTPDIVRVRALNTDPIDELSLHVVLTLFLIKFLYLVKH